MSTLIYNKLMTHDVVIEKLDMNATGDLEVIGSWTEKGFVQYDRHRVHSDKNEEITCDAIAFLKEDSNFDPKHDRWQIKDVKNDNMMHMQGFQVIDDPRSGKTHHYEVSIL